jgi:hypothetical protein
MEIDRLAIDHVRAAIESAVEDREPFAHIRLAEVFPPELYSQMLDAMPASEDYRRMSGRARFPRADVRTKLDLLPEWIANLPPDKRRVWEVVGRALRSAPVREAFRRRLAPGLDRRFGAAHSRVSMYPLPVLTRDVPGYSIKIHPDTPWKAMSIQLYLPRDGSIEHVGTVFHKQRVDGSFMAVTRMRFLPNTGYAFAVGEETYHSAETVGPEVRTRDSILLTYFADRTFFEKAHNRSRRIGNYLKAKAHRIAR